MIVKTVAGRLTVIIFLLSLLMTLSAMAQNSQPAAKNDSAQPIAVPAAKEIPAAAASSQPSPGSDTAAKNDETTLRIAYLIQQQAIPAALSNLDEVVRDGGLPGAQLAIEDNNTTGQFTHQHYRLDPVTVPVDGDLVAAFQSLIAQGYREFITHIPASQLIQLAQLPEAQNLLLLDVATRDDSLRNQSCRNNMLHLLPSRAMRADALAQYMLKKRWKKWFLIIGPSEADRLYGEAIKRAVKRYGLKLVGEKKWTHTYDARRTAQSDVPVFTQVDDYDLLVVADEEGLFGEYLDYRSWLPRPVAGTQGLVPTAWHRTHEQWGAVQLQNRFRKQFGRWMNEEDYAAWLAVRALGEAATRSKSVDPEVLHDYITGDQFGIAGFKGKRLSFRSWNGQLRQPLLLAAPRSLVAVAPLDEFLHPKNELDTLGYDEKESQCLKSK